MTDLWPEVIEFMEPFFPSTQEEMVLAFCVGVILFGTIMCLREIWSWR